MKKDVIEVVFREVYFPKEWTGENPEVIALFPNMVTSYENQPETVASYVHVGQHGDASYDHVIAASRPTKNYQELLDELGQVYGPDFEFKVCSRRPKRREA